MKGIRGKVLRQCLVWCAAVIIFVCSIAGNVQAAEGMGVPGDCQDSEDGNFDGEIFMPGADGAENGGGVSPGTGETGNTGNEGSTSPGNGNTGGGSGTSPGNGNIGGESAGNGTGQDIMGNLFSDGTGNGDNSPDYGDTFQTGEQTDNQTETSGTGGGRSYPGGSYAGGSTGGTSSEKIYRQPKFCLESSSLSDKQIIAGEEDELAVVFRNKSQSEAAYNLKVTVKTEEELCLSFSSFYFAKISPGEAITLSTMVQADSDADAGRATVTYTFDYENVKGEAYTSSEEIFLNIYQPVQAVMEGFSLADSVYSQETVAADLQIRNTGRATIYNVQAALTGQGLFAAKTIYAGTMEPGSAYDGSLKIYIGDKNMTAPGVSGVYNEETAYGETTGTLTLTYEDASGIVYTETQEFTTVIQKPEIIELKVEEENQTNQWWAVSLAAVIFLFTAILAGMWWKLRKKQNQMADLLALREEKRA